MAKAIKNSPWFAFLAVFAFLFLFVSLILHVSGVDAHSVVYSLVKR